MGIFENTLNNKNSKYGYMPKLKDLVAVCRISDPMMESGKATLPAALLKEILMCVLNAQAFDEEAYLTMYPDIREAVLDKRIKDGKTHYVTAGFFEGRQPGIPVDSDFYLKNNSDVAQAVKKGVVKSAAHHFLEVGESESRIASRAYAEFSIAWQIYRQ